jgi:hypothetical protein
MKTLKFYLPLIVILLMAAGVMSQTVDPVERYLENYRMALKSDNTGLTESAIINIIKMKMVYPQADYSKVVDALKRLMVKSPSQTIRYEAYLALGYLEYPDQFSWIEASGDQQIDKLLVNLVINLPKQTIGEN